MSFSELQAGLVLSGGSDNGGPMRSSKADIFISGDVETDGPIPGEFSMLSIGFVVVGTYDGVRFDKEPGDVRTFYRELRPISQRFEAEAVEVNGLDRDRLLREGGDPAEVMNDAHAWVRGAAEGKNAVFVGYPAAFDWMWLFWYFTKYAESGSPFGFAQCFDIKSMIATTWPTVFSDAKKRMIPTKLQPLRPHTHHALDDARSQGELFAHIFSYLLENRSSS